MVNKRQTGQSRLSRRWRTALLAGSLGLSVTLFTGCSTPTPVANVSPPADPLHGVLTPPGMPQPTNAPKASVGWNPPPAQQFGVADTTSTNNATLAGMWQGPLGKPSPIDENGKTQTPGQLTTGGPKTTQTPVNPGFTAPNPSPKVVPIPDAKPNTSTSSWQPVQLNNPVPLPASTITAPTVQPIGAAPTNAPTVQTVGSAASVSSDQLAKQLQDRGVINQKLDLDPDNPKGVVLTCYIQRPNNQGFRIVDARASDYAGAARSILQQLDAAR